MLYADNGSPYPFACTTSMAWAFASVYVALEEGVTMMEASFGGMGGCTFVPGAKGNIATEDRIYMLHDMGIETGYDLVKLNKTAVQMGIDVQARPAARAILCMNP